MEKYVITKAAVVDLIAWIVREFGVVKFPEKKKSLWISFGGFRQVDVRMEIVVKSGLNIPETVEKFRAKLAASLEKLAGLNVRESTIIVRGLYDESVEN
ncbi:Asp23/Gls24 family envelope stress response protein [Thermospira aquatica]|uniref:Asp23/Gls24 family envelope stress response protein n=1 Tax=Thermospira aquatica TaxID=2828656 RepID=A0AAX3BCJ8_9SPIR|nr:Asp23/Gls24 family envelope stress response protein [Thermospira aquatica]URA10037.1 Asp23/Gls24 family envelope stress response protein [Thermospira aquatica]